MKEELRGLVAGAVGSSQIPPRVMMPVSESRFFDKAGYEYTFHRGAHGQVTHLVMQWTGGGEAMRRERMPD